MSITIPWCHPDSVGKRRRDLSINKDHVLSLFDSQWSNEFPLLKVNANAINSFVLYPLSAVSWFIYFIKENGCTL